MLCCETESFLHQTFLSKLDAFAKTANNTEAEQTTETTQQQGQPEETPVLDFVNEIKAQAMVNSFEQAGFIYEPTSGLYYDTKSGYYYSPQHDLYYNGSNANWYRLNPRTHEFIFHSGTEASQAVKKVTIVSLIRVLVPITFCAIAGSVGAVG